MKLRAAIAGLRDRFTLAGRLVGIVAALLVVDFAANSLMFERASTFAVNYEEAARMADHLVIARRMAGAVPAERRHEMVRQLSTERFEISWRVRRKVETDPMRLSTLRQQIIAAEPELSRAGLQLHLLPIAQGAGIGGSVLLPDGSALVFRSSNATSWSLNAGLLLRFSLPSVFLLALAWWLVRSSFKPLHALVRATVQVGTDDLDPLPLAGPSEVRQLIAAFHRMHERINQLLASRTQTLLAIGHDLRTPLARLQLRLEGANLDEETRAEMIGDITQVSELLASLQSFVECGQDGGDPELFDLAAMARNQVDEGRDLGLDVTYAGPDSLPITAHPASIRRAIANLVQNALHFAGNAEIYLRETNGAIVLQVADRGPGIPEDRLIDVLQPFTRLDTARARNTRGMGLGLAIVDRVVRAEGGRLELANRPEGGLCATITLPAALPSKVTGAVGVQRNNS